MAKKKNNTATKKTTPQRRMSKAEMRVAIANDVIIQLHRGTLQAKEGVWIQDSKLGTLEDFVQFRSGSVDFNEPVSPCNFVANAKSCKVCALGALFMSSFKLFNPNIKLKDGWEAWAIFEELDTSPLNKYFSPQALTLIEACFEDNNGTHDCDWDAQGIASAYANSFDDPSERLMAIMKNIKRNNGEFKPEQDINIKGALVALKTSW